VQQRACRSTLAQQLAPHLSTSQPCSQQCLPPSSCPQKHESLRARSARTSPQGPAPAAAADDPMGGGGQDENAAQLLLAIGKQ
jgi:hypothetical protein